MRLGVLDIGSNTGHLLVVDAHRGAAPLPAYSHKEPLRLAEHLEDGEVTKSGIKALTKFVADAVVVAEDKGAHDMLGFATSAVRDARNSDAVLDHVADETGVRIAVLPGDDEARLTFLAVRRWFGWSAGRLAVFDIGGGSLEIAGGSDEEPDVAWSIPLGAARLAREHFRDGNPGDSAIRALRKKIRADIAEDAGRLLRGGPPDMAAATSKTFRSLARICGAAPSEDGPLVGSRARPRRPAEVDPEADRHGRRRPGRAAGRLAEPDAPDRPGCARRRGGDGHLRPGGAADLPVGTARRRDPRAPRPALRPGPA